MQRCPSCGGESPDDSLHCVHCGFALREDAEAAPMVSGPGVMRPSIKDSANRTAAFDMRELPLAVGEEDTPSSEPAPAPKNPLAGLPRPRVASAPSPLTGGLGKPGSASESTRLRAGRTVMGMPVFSPSAGTSAEGQGAGGAAPAADDGGITALHDFASELADAADTGGGVADELVSAVEAAAPDRAQAATGPIGPGNFAPTEAMQVTTNAMVDAASAAPPTDAQPAVQVGRGVPEDPTPLAEPPRHAHGAHDTDAQPAARASDEAAGMGHDHAQLPDEAALSEADAEGADIWRLVGGFLGLLLLAVFAYPLGGAPFWEAMSNYQGTARLAFIGVGVSGVLLLAGSALPLPRSARNGLFTVLAAVGVGCIFLT